MSSEYAEEISQQGGSEPQGSPDNEKGAAPQPPTVLVRGETVIEQSSLETASPT